MRGRQPRRTCDAAPGTSAPMCGPAFSARASSCCVPSGVLGTILVLDAMPAALLAQVLAQQLAGERIEQADVRGVPLHSHTAADPARRRAVVGRFDFDAAIQMHRAFAVLVVAERFQRQRQQRRLLFGEHRRDLSLGGAVDARVGPALFPAVQIGLRFFQALEAQPFQRRLLGVSDAGLHLALAIRIANAARQRDRAVVSEHIAIQRIQRGIVDVGCEHAFAQVVEHHDARGSTQPAKGLLVQLGPDSRAGPEHQQTNGFAAVAERQHEQPRAPVVAGVRIAHHGAVAVIDLRFLAGRSFDHRAGFRRGGAAQLADEALDALVARREAVAVHQVLPDGHGVAARATAPAR